MTAEEARQLASASMAKRDLRTYLQSIEQRAKDGAYETRFGKLGPREIAQFRLLGYKCREENGGLLVSWGSCPI